MPYKPHCPEDEMKPEDRIVTIYDYPHTKEMFGHEDWAKFRLNENGSVDLIWTCGADEEGNDYITSFRFPEYEQLLAALMELGGLNSDYWLHALPMKLPKSRMIENLQKLSEKIDGE
jgi:hypothetical protein